VPDPEAPVLRDRIWNTFPVAQPAFAKLLALLDIEVSREVPTAAVTLGTRSRLRINPDFAAARCASDQALVMLVLHELFHVVLGHTRLYDRSTPALNFAFDAVINAQLCLLHPGPEWTRLFRESYGAQDPPWCLLRPPEGWRTPAERWLPGSLGALHRRLYTDASVSYEDLFRMLARELGDGEGAEGVAELLGDHGAGDGEPADPGVLAEVREIIARWPMVTQRSGRDLGGPGLAWRVEAQSCRSEATRILRRALRHLGETGAGGLGRPRLAQAPSPAVLPLRDGGDRRASVLEACGGEPLLFAGETRVGSILRGERVHVYLDVSGSMEGLVAPLYAALSRLADWMAPQVHLFSTTVKDITREELARGRCFSTQGTAISVVTAHMVAKGVRRALIVTDGWVGAVPSEHARELSRRKGRFAVAVTAGGDPAFAAALGAEVHLLPSLLEPK